MKHWKTTMILIASLVLTVFLGLAGCDEDHKGRHIRSDRDRRPPEHKRDHRDRHKDRGRDSDHDRDKHGVNVTW
jgi:hypothetical protein